MTKATHLPYVRWNLGRGHTSLWHIVSTRTRDGGVVRARTKCDKVMREDNCQFADSVGKATICEVCQKELAK